MKKSPIFFCILMFALSSPALAETIYKQPNNQANFVKIEKFKSPDGETLSQPYNFDETQLRAILSSLKYGKKLILLKESKNRDLYEVEYIDKFVPYLMQAFAKVKPDQAVVWSVVQKRPYFIIRNDKLTIVRMWVVGSELHMDFIKTEAKLQGDYQAKTTGQKLIDDAKSIGVTIEPQQGQKFGLNSTDELIIDLKVDWPTIAANLAAEDERLRQEAEAEKAAKKGHRTANATPAAAAPTSLTTTTTSGSAPAAKPAISPVDQKNAQTRLTELKSLKDKGLISEKDYEQKKAEILKDL
ncbi:MAG TPA: SHOCT domain-containing protein [bacterium]|nr:SHOCT domain-containing protein [bacterium]